MAALEAATHRVSGVLTQFASQTLGGWVTRS
jgi:hypothetical protein